MTTSPTRRRRRWSHALALVSLAVGTGLTMTACGDDDDDATDDGEAVIIVTDAWARTSPAGTTTTAAYMLISNRSDVDDAIVSVAVDDDVATGAEIHETRPAVTEPDDTTAGATAMDGTAAGGPTTAPMTEMAPVDRLELPAGSTIVLGPGGLHVMIVDLAEPLLSGDEVELTLTFERAGELTVTALVGDEAP